MTPPLVVEEGAGGYGSVTDANATSLHVTHRGDFPELERALRQVTLRGDPTILPYAKATITSRRLPIAELRPIATYVLAPQLAYQRRIQAALAERGVDLFELDGLITYELDGVSHTMSPPIVETAYDPALGEVVSALLDGQHRVWLAREQGRDIVRVVEITHVTQNIPILSVPVRWEDVRVVESVPPDTEKRRFRYDSQGELRAAVCYFTDAPITEESYRYFLYRDLAVLGSPGIRSAGKE